ncbi:hypothetical protein ACFW0F_06860 [Brucella anthropi]|uniref:hypothetical protein n=1 Tax=Brucella anthropi TaxID=529 RepID=UPI00366B1D83
MKEISEGVVIHNKPDGTFDAVVVLDSRVVWQQPGYRTREAANAEAKQQFDRLKRIR